MTIWTNDHLFGRGLVGQSKYSSKPIKVFKIRPEQHNFLDQVPILNLRCHLYNYLMSFFFVYVSVWGRFKVFKSFMQFCTLSLHFNPLKTKVFFVFSMALGSLSSKLFLDFLVLGFTTRCITVISEWIKHRNKYKYILIHSASSVHYFHTCLPYDPKFKNLAKPWKNLPKINF